MSNGWIKLHRQIEDNELWFLEPFTRGQAWVDLLLLANHDPKAFHIRGNRVEVQRGQVARAATTFAERWKWSKGKVLSFFEYLEKCGMIDRRISHVIAVITIRNYEEYQHTEPQDEPQTGRQNDRRPDDRPDTNKKEKKVKKEKKAKLSGMTERTDEATEREFRAAAQAEGWCDRHYLDKTLTQLHALSREHRAEAFRKMRVLANAYRSQSDRTRKLAKRLFHEIAGFVNDHGHMERSLTDQEIALRRQFAEEESGRRYVEEEMQ
jgi:hypothetical protein